MPPARTPTCSSRGRFKLVHVDDPETANWYSTLAPPSTAVIFRTRNLSSSVPQILPALGAGAGGRVATVRAGLDDATVTFVSVWAAAGVAVIWSETVGSAHTEPGKVARQTVSAKAVGMHAEDLGIMMAPFGLAVVSEGGALRLR